MATPYKIVASEGFDIYAEGVMPQDWAWFNGSLTNVGQVTAGTSPFPNSKGMSFNRGTTSALANSYQFPNGGTFQRNNTAAAGKMIAGFNAWIRIDTVAATVAATPLAYFTTASSPTTVAMPIFGISNSNAAGLNLLFPSTIVGFTTPFQLTIETGVWYWVSVRFALAPNGVLRASYAVNNIVLQDDVAVAMGTDPIGTNLLNRVAFMSAPTTYTWSMDDFVVQASNGSLTDWPAGGGGTAPVDPSVNDLPLISPRRIYALPVVSNGSITQWTPTNGLPNYQAATEAGESVEALDSDLTDLYKWDVPDGLAVSDVIGVNARASTNKYLTVEPVIRENATATVLSGSGVTTKNTNRFISIYEQTPSGTVWDAASVELAEFGQKSL